LSFFAVLRGPLGAGKTTLAERLAHCLGGQVVSIDRILEVNDLERWEDGYVSEGSFLRANRFALTAAEPLLRHGTPVVFDGNFYWRSVVLDLLQRLTYPGVVFTLHLPMELCAVRDAGRPRPLGPEAVRDVYRKVATFDYGIGIDASGTVDETVSRLLAALRTAGMPGV
jgi:predicted kinase